MTSQLPYIKGPKGAHTPVFGSFPCGHTAGWMKTPFCTEVDLGPGHIVFDGDPATPRERGTAAPSFRPMSIVATVVHLSYVLSCCLSMKKDLMEVQHTSEHAVKTSSICAANFSRAANSISGKLPWIASEGRRRPTDQRKMYAITDCARASPVLTATG